MDEAGTGMETGLKTTIKAGTENRTGATFRSILLTVLHPVPGSLRYSS